MTAGWTLPYSRENLYVTLQADLIGMREELAAKRTQLAGVFEEINTTKDDTRKSELVVEAGKRNKELAELVDKIEPVQQAVLADEANREAMKAMRQPVGRQVKPETEQVEHIDPSTSEADEILAAGHKSVGELLHAGLESTGRKSARDGGNGFKGYRGPIGEMAVKTLISSSTFGTLLEDRRPGIQLSAQEERTVADLMLSGTTTAQKVTYIEETTFTNAAAETAEAGEKPEGALAGTLREDNVRKIATWIPVTDETLEDLPFFESYLRSRLAFMVRQREELQLLRGDGVGQNILGVYNRTGVQTVTGYAMSTIDSILAAITEVQKDAFVEPTAFVVHPTDWFQIRTSKDENGNYLLGPATLDPMAARPWGLQVRVTTNAIENTGLVGAFNQAMVVRRSGIEIAISTEHSTYFIENKLAVRAEERLALAVFRPAAFCKVEAIVQGS